MCEHASAMDTDTDLADVAYGKALDMLNQSYRPEGYVASSAQTHYDAIWAEDPLITPLGANLTGSDEVLGASRRTLETLAGLQACGFDQLPSATLDQSAAANRVGTDQPWDFSEWLHG